MTPIMSLTILFCSLYTVMIQAFVLNANSSSTSSHSHQNRCLYGPPCSCKNIFGYDSSSVDCSSKGLTAVPDGVIVQGQKYNNGYSLDILFLILDNNTLHNLTAGQFRLLKTAVETKYFKTDPFFRIYLYGNVIRNIDNDTFDGIAHLVQTLDLSSNLLTSIPSCVESLDNLQDLYLGSNPVLEFDPVLMNNLAPRLRGFDYGSSALPYWSSSLRRFTGLTEIGLYDMPWLTSIPDSNLFIPYPGSIEGVNMEGLGFTDLSELVCFFENATYFNIYRNTQFDKFTPCSNPSNETRSLTLKFANTELFPNISGSPNFPRYTIIFEDSFNFLSSVVSEDFKNITNIVIDALLLNYNFLTKVPVFINQLSNVTVLELSSNYISRISWNDFGLKPHVKTLTLSYNPIDSIADSSFSGFTHDNFQLYLAKTNLLKLPYALSTLSNMNTLVLAGTDGIIRQLLDATSRPLELPSTSNHLFIDAAEFDKAWNCSCGFPFLNRYSLVTVSLYCLPNVDEYAPSYISQYTFL